MREHALGLIGVGLVGTALAERLLDAGWRVVGFDAASKQLDQLSLLGGHTVTAADEVCSAANTIILSLPTSEIATQVIESLKTPLTGKTIIDTTTGEPDRMAALGRHLAERGANYLDATIAGSSAQVRTGEVIVMVGGDSATITQCEEIFRSFSVRQFHVGPWGAGARMKLVVNLVLGLNRAVLAEGLNFAERYGVSSRLAIEVLRAGPAYSRVMDTKGEKMLADDFTPQARLAQHLKDVQLILEAGEDCGAMLPLSTIHEQLLSQLVAAGFGDLDNSAIIKAFRL